MDYSAAINKIMPEVNSGSTEPFIIYRDTNGGWHSDYTRNQYGETLDWVEGVKAQDPFAGEYSGKDFSKGSYPYVYDVILCDRIQEECYINRNYGKDDHKSLNALVSFFVDNISEFPREVTDYLTSLERPLAAIKEMCPFNMATDQEGWYFNEDLAADAVDYIERAVDNRLYSHKDTPVPGKQPNGGYADLNKISINDSTMILSENPDAEYRYMVVENRYTAYYNNSGDNNIYTGHTNDYLEAITEFTKRVQYNIDCVQSRRDTRERLDGVSHTELSDGDCLPDSRNEDYTGKLIIVKASELKPEYRSAESQLVVCSHGNGARPDAIGTSVFGKELFSGDTVCYGRHQVAGIADPAKLPEWAKKKIALTEIPKEPGVVKLPDDEPPQKTKTSPKPSLRNKLEHAKETARKAGEGSDKPKKRRDMEVT